jgi:hypothetical protein
MVVSGDSAACGLTHMLHSNRNWFVYPTEEAAHVPIKGKIGQR